MNLKYEDSMIGKAEVSWKEPQKNARAMADNAVLTATPSSRTTARTRDRPWIGRKSPGATSLTTAATLSTASLTAAIAATPLAAAAPAASPMATAAGVTTALIAATSAATPLVRSRSSCLQAVCGSAKLV